MDQVRAVTLAKCVLCEQIQSPKLSKIEKLGTRTFGIICRPLVGAFQSPLTAFFISSHLIAIPSNPRSMKLFSLVSRCYLLLPFHSASSQKLRIFELISQVPESTLCCKYFPALPLLFRVPLESEEVSPLS